MHSRWRCSLKATRSAKGSEFDSGSSRAWRLGRRGESSADCRVSSLRAGLQSAAVGHAVLELEPQRRHRKNLGVLLPTNVVLSLTPASHQPQIWPFTSQLEGKFLEVVCYLQSHSLAFPINCCPRKILWRRKRCHTTNRSSITRSTSERSSAPVIASQASLAMAHTRLVGCVVTTGQVQAPSRQHHQLSNKALLPAPTSMWLSRCPPRCASSLQPPIASSGYTSISQRSNRHTQGSRRSAISTMHSSLTGRLANTSV